MMNSILLSLSTKKEEVIDRFYKVLFVNIYFKISKIEMASQTIFFFSILKIVLKSESQTCII